MKNKKKIIIIIISAIVIGVLSWIIGTKFLNKQEEEKILEKGQITPLMYEITKEGSNNKIYLFGSIHVANLNEFDFPKYIIDAYQNSHYLACEADIVEYQKDNEKLMNEALKMMYQDGTTIKDHISNETYNKLINFLTEKGLYTPLYDYYKPYFFESLLTVAMTSDAKINANTGIDTYFLQEAKKDNKTILEVESVDFQNNLLFSFKDELYELIINETIDNYDNEVNSLKELYQAWKKGNVNDIMKFSNDDMDIEDSYTDEQKKQIEDYNKKVIDERNAFMTNKLIEYFNNNQDVFYMVGTLHLIGNDGIANLLTKEGFTVKQINNSVN
jgi:uncharacterized protein YbaP (TraB family)